MPDRDELDELTAHYRDTLLLIQNLLLDGVPGWLRPKLRMGAVEVGRVAVRLRDAQLIALRAYDRDTVIPALKRVETAIAEQPGKGKKRAA